jgi:hypothetical protein
MLGSCMVVRVYNHLPAKYLGYEASSESGKVYSAAELFMSEERYNGLHEYFQSVFPFRYENYAITIYINNMRAEHQDTMLCMYIDECRITLPSGRIIIVPMDNNKVNYSYTGRDYKRRAPPKTLQDVQPQYTEDGRKVLYLDSIVGNDKVWIKFFAKIPSSAQTLRLEYSFTVVWENLSEVKMRYSLLFKKISFITNIPTV